MALDELTVDGDDSDTTRVTLLDGGLDALWIEAEDAGNIIGVRLNGETVEQLVEWLHEWQASR